MRYPLDFTYYLPTKTINKAFKGLSESLSLQSRIVGKSQLHQPLTAYSWGSGKVSVAIWTQMHGNETTGTFSVLDLLQHLIELPKTRLEEIKSEVTLHLLPNLNPDGSDLFTRRSFSGVDLNRDSVSLSTPEMKAFWQWIEEVKPNLALNMHDQRSRFKAGDQVATLSFLAPSPDKSRSNNKARLVSKSIIGQLYKSISAKYEVGLGKYTDEFYPLATGDNLIARNIPTILFEAGVDAFDENSRETARKIQTECLISIIEGAKSLLENPSNEHITLYDEIPVNEDSMCDYLLRGITIPNTEVTADVAIDIHRFMDVNKNFKQSLIIREIGDLSSLTPVYNCSQDIIDKFTKVNIQEIAGK